MKRMIAVMLACIFTVQVYGVCFAMDDKGEGMQGKKKMEQTMEKRQAKHVEKMTKELNLTPEQKTKLEAILKENGDNMKAEMEKMKETHKTMQEAKDQKIKEILTPEQAQKFDKMKEENKAKMEKKMKKHGGKCDDDKDMK